MKEKNDGTVAKVDLTLFYNHLKEFFFPSSGEQNFKIMQKLCL